MFLHRHDCILIFEENSGDSPWVFSMNVNYARRQQCQSRPLSMMSTASMTSEKPAAAGGVPPQPPPQAVSPRNAAAGGGGWCFDVIDAVDVIDVIDSGRG